LKVNLLTELDIDLVLRINEGNGRLRVLNVPADTGCVFVSWSACPPWFNCAFGTTSIPINEVSIITLNKPIVKSVSANFYTGGVSRVGVWFHAWLLRACQALLRNKVRGTWA